MRPPNALSPGVHFPLHHWRTNWNCPSKLLPRHCPTRHVLCRSPLPLRTLHRGRFCNSSRIHPLIPTPYRIHLTPDMSKSSLRSNIHRSKPNIFPTAFPRTSRNAPAILRLPRRLYNVKHRVLYRLPNLNSSGNHTTLYYLRGLLS